MSGNARLNILARVRQAQVKAYLPEAAQGLPERLAYADLDQDALASRLAARRR